MAKRTDVQGFLLPLVPAGGVEQLAPDGTEQEALSALRCPATRFSCLLFSLIKTFWGSIPDFLVSLSFADIAKIKRAPGACFSSGVSEASCTTGTFWKQNKLKEEIPQLKEFAASFTGAWQVKSIPHVKFSSLCLVLQDVQTLL